MKRSNQEMISDLKTIIGAQQELLRISLWVMSQGPADFCGEQICCAVHHDQVRAACATSMGAGQSVNTILKGADQKGIPVRDLYPIARCVVEGFINAAFFLTEDVEVSQRALRHKDYAVWKHVNRVVGNGDFAFRLSTGEDQKNLAKNLFPEFFGRGNESWSKLDAPSKINRIGKVCSRGGSALLGAYGLIYSTSSEIIHGSVYGMAYFMSTSQTGKEPKVDDFLSSTESQFIDILAAVSHALSGYLSTFAKCHKSKPFIDIERELFKNLYKAIQGEDLVEN